jgi:hypothetical protein
LGGRREERVEVLFDDLLALLHDLLVLDFRPCTANPTADYSLLQTFPHLTIYALSLNTIERP